MTSFETYSPEQQREIGAAHDEIGRLLGYLRGNRPPMTDRQVDEYSTWIANAYSSATLHGVLALLSTHIAELHREAVCSIEVPTVETDQDVIQNLDRQHLTFVQLTSWLDDDYEEVGFVHRCLGVSLRQGLSA